MNEVEKSRMWREVADGGGARGAELRRSDVRRVDGW